MDELDHPVSIQTYQVLHDKLKLLYPAVIHHTPYTAEHAMNTTIVNAVNKQLHDQGYPKNPMTDVTAYYELKNNQRGVLSLTLWNYAFSGGAHGLTIQNALTFNTETGKTYALKDLFKPGSDYIGKLSEIIKAEIKVRNIPLLVDFKAIRPDQDFYIADKSLVIYFQVYELAAYVYGFLYFPISVYALQDIIAEDGPLGKMFS
ncbi:DUF3298 and DUF4163 domain-containing protein [Paenibacillus aceris]|uniref:DUF3298/DUF4163 domain-containing protein n=1 Tax=Paenibacillus aceris TaxID=869555 RepID=A0ABS4I1G3_9BACL|nr:DUF3298 and DUF4163 domain-containing protein [Paenibacillus aceris]MBP1964758.1 hypothetical protein [Paenibacillus aceris]NHW33741.1 DUF3298 and DUF4163 domain-containing protein [Paenibacillus aceris]